MENQVRQKRNIILTYERKTNEEEREGKNKSGM
jgi:hypothetical protein